MAIPIIFTFSIYIFQMSSYVISTGFIIIFLENDSIFSRVSNV